MASECAVSDPDRLLIDSRRLDRYYIPHPFSLMHLTYHASRTR